ncbi:MAG: hypothetical protein WBV82_24420 [Myxococcaceae bacterium]|jgi:hypothetical protein
MTGSAAARLAPALAPVEEIELNRTVYLYGVAGRQRTAVGSTIFKMLRAADWSRYAS